MKKIIFLIAFACFTISLFAQTDTSSVYPGTVSITSNTSIQLSKDGYLQKARHQRTAGIILISGGGAVMAAGGLIIIAHGISDGASAVSNTISTIGGAIAGADGTGGSHSGTSSSSATAKHNNSFATALLVTGVASMLGSIPLFISAHHNKLNALSMSFKNEFIPGLQNDAMASRFVPAISFRLRF